MLGARFSYSINNHIFNDFEAQNFISLGLRAKPFYEVNSTYHGEVPEMRNRGRTVWCCMPQGKSRNSSGFEMFAKDFEFKAFF